MGARTLQPDQLTITRYRDADGTYRDVIDHFPDRLLVSQELIDNGDPIVVGFDGERLTLKVSNGHAVYRVVRWERFSDRRWDVCHMEAVEREWHCAE